MLAMLFARDDDVRRRFLVNDVSDEWQRGLFVGNWMFRLTPDEADELGRQLFSIVDELRRRPEQPSEAVQALVSISILPCWTDASAIGKFLCKLRCSRRVTQAMASPHPRGCTRRGMKLAALLATGAIGVGAFAGAASSVRGSDSTRITRATPVPLTVADRRIPGARAVRTCAAAGPRGETRRSPRGRASLRNQR